MRVLCLALSASLMAWSAQADVNIAGQWTFQADVENDCDFGGTAYLEKVGEGRYEGELTAQQSCPTLPEDYLVRQSCEATEIGNQLSVRCQIVEFVNGFASEFYFPDNFTLTVQSSARMHGALVSAGRARPAEWVRDEGGIS